MSISENCLYIHMANFDFVKMWSHASHSHARLSLWLYIPRLSSSYSQIDAILNACQHFRITVFNYVEKTESLLAVSLGYHKFTRWLMKNDLRW